MCHSSATLSSLCHIYNIFPMCQVWVPCLLYIQLPSSGPLCCMCVQFPKCVVRTWNHDVYSSWQYLNVICSVQHISVGIPRVVAGIYHLGCMSLGIPFGFKWCFNVLVVLYGNVRFVFRNKLVIRVVLVYGLKYVNVAHFVLSFCVFGTVCVGFLGALFLCWRFVGSCW
jgi:hypothetical protein